MSEQVQNLTVRQLFETGRYVIPLYQRNYAWGEEEVTQLIHDIWDSYQADDTKAYYIGSLVVAKRSSERGEYFEVIDGQQRHTTLSILLAYLKDKHNIAQTNLDFECRDLSSNTLKSLFEGKVEGQEGMITAYKTCKNLIPFVEQPNSPKDNKLIIKDFTNYLLKHVVILRTEVPEETDLNHYFEIMNNRGEQLEKHEVLKARFLNALKGDAKATSTFAKVWDACADMNRYVVMGFEAGVRKELFGDDLDKCPDALTNIVSLNQPGDGKAQEVQNTVELENLLTGHPTIKSEKKGKLQPDERFSSIIDFPNFLLHVLRISGLINLKKTGEPVVLDDKKLLDAFVDTPKVDDAKAFISSLLKTRFLFDRYIIKREHDESNDSKWSMKKLVYKPKKDNKSAYYGYDNNFSKKDNEATSEQQSLIMVQSMFHVSYPTRNYKYWLNAALAYLYNYKSGADLSGEVLLEYFETLSDRFFFNRFAAEVSQEYDAMLKDGGAVKEASSESLEGKFTYTKGVHAFVFNRLDYLLWKLKKLDTSNQFLFSFKRSVEHFSSQHLGEGQSDETKVKEESTMHSFGNLALVTGGFNSSLSDKSIDEKVAMVANLKKGNVASSVSLKLRLMCESSKKEEGWTDGKAKAHEKEMLNILCEKSPYVV